MRYGHSDDFRDYRAPRWHDVITDLAPVIILAALILAITFDRIGWLA